MPSSLSLSDLVQLWHNSKTEMLQPRKQNDLCVVMTKLISKYDQITKKKYEGNWAVSLYFRLTYSLFFWIRKDEIFVIGVTNFLVTLGMSFFYSNIKFFSSFNERPLIKTVPSPTHSVLPFLLCFSSDSKLSRLFWFFLSQMNS